MRFRLVPRAPRIRTGALEFRPESDDAEYLDGLLGEKLAHPGDDLLSGLVERVAAGELSRPEAAHMSVLMLFAGRTKPRLTPPCGPPLANVGGGPLCWTPAQECRQPSAEPGITIRAYTLTQCHDHCYGNGT
ncbi:hypothetical protein AB0F17_41140 [Nonomuraea sp. NPDC026600]|uniref:hypothetical protein n=1 Tax=Nonomuraea sp. NPDC026600 TaxID=3155363 RepID=UPI0033FD337E